ncbi:esterase [Streptomyces sp. NPDC056291]|uniref:esterase n=1 Tax=Streptomyces sp. NPDC056291 TaxID=3345772 RepID=UPI0035E36CC1
MPSGVRGALVQRVSALPEGPLDVSWLPAGTPRPPLDRIRLHWEPSSRAGWDVTAHLGLATTEVLLASWPAAPDNWPRLVRPTTSRSPVGPEARPRRRGRRVRWSGAQGGDVGAAMA